MLDDELPGLAYLRNVCEQIPDVEVVKAFNDSQKFVNEFPELDFDICILDIEMPVMNGLDVARNIRKPVIFTTAYKEHAAEAFDVDAIDYIRKPIEKGRLEKALQKASRYLEDKKNKEGHLLMNTNKGKSLIHFNRIAFITTSDTDKRDKCLYMKEGDKIIVKNISFDQLNAALPENSFCRINKKDIVALSCVRFYTHQEITVDLKNSSEVKMTLSENYKTDFLKRMLR